MFEETETNWKFNSDTLENTHTCAHVLLTVIRKTKSACGTLNSSPVSVLRPKHTKCVFDVRLRSRVEMQHLNLNNLLCVIIIHDNMSVL